MAFTPAELAELQSLDLPETDGQPMDSDWQRIETTFLIEVGRHHFRHQKTGYFGGNMCFYYSLKQARHLEFLGPDFFFVKDAEPHKLRKKWEIWKENNLFPNVIVEYLSPSTQANDLGKKKTIYERTFQTREYFVYEPDDVTLLGWRLSPITNLYEPIEADEDGRLYSDELNLLIGPWHGTLHGQTTTWLRFFDEDGSLVLSPEEEERRQKTEERQQKQLAQRIAKEENAARKEERAAKEAALADKEAALADKEAALAAKEAERLAKEAAFAEIERLKKLLESRPNH